MHRAEGFSLICSSRLPVDSSSLSDDKWKLIVGQGLAAIVHRSNATWFLNVYNWQAKDG